MTTGIDIAHGPDRVTITLVVNGKVARIAVTPEKAKRLAGELASAAMEADAVRRTTSEAGGSPEFRESLDKVLEILRGKKR